MQDWRRIIAVTRLNIQTLGATQLTARKDGKTVLYVKLDALDGVNYARSTMDLKMEVVAPRTM